MTVDRRTALRNISIGTGITISSGALISILPSCKVTPTVNWVPEFFSGPEARLIEEMAELILPKTDTPGALDCGIGPFVDRMINNVFLPKQKSFFRKGLYHFVEGDLSTRKVPNLTSEEISDQLHLALENLSQESYQKLVKITDNPTYNSDEATDHETKYSFLISVKRLTILGYFSSQLIGEEYLNYDPIPGLYWGCVPISDIGNSWSLV